jgi:hypothetical protein
MFETEVIHLTSEGLETVFEFEKTNQVYIEQAGFEWGTWDAVSLDVDATRVLYEALKKRFEGNADAL